MDISVKTIREVFFSKEELKMINSLSVKLSNDQFQQVLELLPFYAQRNFKDLSVQNIFPIC